jgi:hypothetical protein
MPPAGPLRAVATEPGEQVVAGLVLFGLAQQIRQSLIYSLSCWSDLSEPADTIGLSAVHVNRVQEARHVSYGSKRESLLYRHMSASAGCGHSSGLGFGSLGRVEDGRGSLGHAATLRFPSPLIEPDVRISDIAEA